MSLVFGVEVPAAAVLERESVGDADLLDSGNGSDAADDFLKSGAALIAAAGVVVVVYDVVRLDGGCVGGLEAEVDVHDLEEAAQQQASADEKDAGEGDF